MRAEVTLSGEGFTYIVPLGAEMPSPTGGGAVWEEIVREQREPITDYTGSAALRQKIPVLFDGFSADRDIEPELLRVVGLWMTDEEPPSFIATGPIRFPGRRWVMEEPEYGDGLRNDAGALVRQALTLNLLEYRPLDALAFTSTGSTGPKKRKQKRGTYTTVAADTLIKVSQRVYGSPKQAKWIGDLNSIRDTRKKLKAGTVLKLPHGIGPA